MPRTEVRGGQILDASVSLTADVTGVLPVANGGTGAASQTLNNVLLGNGTGAFQNIAPGATGNVLSSNGTTWSSAAPSAGAKTYSASVGMANADYVTDGMDDHVQIQAAIDAVDAAGGGTVFIQAGNYSAATVTLKDSVSLVGSGPKTIITLKASSGTLFLSESFSTSTGTGTDTAGIKRFMFGNMTLLGNSANQTDSAAGDYKDRHALIKIYGYNFKLHDLWINDSKEQAIYTEHDGFWSNAFNQTEFGEAVYENIFIKNYGKVGWVNRGPHDSTIKAVYISSYNASGLLAQYGYRGELSGATYGSQGVVVDNLHVWGEHSVNAVYINGGTITQGRLYAEGATAAAIYLATGGNHFEAVVGYAATGIEVNANNDNLIQAIVESNITGYVVKLNGSAAGNVIEVIKGVGASGVYQLSAYTGGNNTYLTNHPYASTLISGTPATSDRVDFTSDNYPDNLRESRYEWPVGDKKYKITSASGIDAGGIAQINTVLTSPTNAFAEVTNIVSSAAPTPTGGSRENELYVTAGAAGMTIAAPTGTPAHGNKLLIAIYTVAAQSLALNAIFVAIGVTIPATTVAGKWTYIGAKYNATAAKWHVLAVGQQA